MMHRRTRIAALPPSFRTIATSIRSSSHRFLRKQVGGPLPKSVVTESKPWWNPAQDEEPDWYMDMNPDSRPALLDSNDIY